MALKQRLQQAGVEAGEETQVAAVAGSVLVVGRVGVECLQKHGRVGGTLGQDENVDVLLMRQATDEAVQVGPVQIPEEELGIGTVSVVWPRVSVNLGSA